MIQYIKLEKIQPGMELARTVYDEKMRLEERIQPHPQNGETPVER